MQTPDKMSKSTLKCLSRLAIFILCILGLIELGLALWTTLDYRYKSLAYILADVGYIDLWILRYLSLCLFASSIITLVMCLILIWGLYSAHVLLFIASTMVALIVIGEFTVSMLTFKSKSETRLTLMVQLPKLVTTYLNGNDERANRALDILQATFYCCGTEGRLVYSNNVPLSCNMFNEGCLGPTMFFLDSWMDALSYILLFFSLIKLFIVIYFYSFLCLNYQYRQKRLGKKNRDLINDSSMYHHSSSFNSSSTENLPKRILMSSTRINQDESDNSDHEYNDNRRVLLDDYDSLTSPTKQTYTTTIISPSSFDNHGLTTYYEQHGSRKLSSISEKTEQNETDESESDPSRLKLYKPKRKVIVTNIQQKYHPPAIPKRLSIIKNRRNILREDENDSGVEYSSSEKLSDDHKQHSQNKSNSSLGFSKVFVTSTSQDQTFNDEIRKPFTISDPLFSNEIILIPKPILKKSNQQSPSIYRNRKITSPTPIPRSTLKQLQQDESFV